VRYVNSWAHNVSICQKRDGKQTINKELMKLFYIKKHKNRQKFAVTNREFRLRKVEVSLGESPSFLRGKSEGRFWGGLK
jgi:hypothetical protein